MKNSIYLRRKNKVIVQLGSENLETKYLATILKNIESIGFTFSEALIERLLTLNLDDLTNFYNETVETLKNIVGDNKKFKPMYPNFPKQVMNMNSSDLYFNAILHYLGDAIGVRILPKYDREERPLLEPYVNLKVIDLGSEEDFRQMACNLIAAKTSISETDKKDIAYFVECYQDNLDIIIPNEIPHKENLAYLASIILQITDFPISHITKFFKTATDVLRLATAFSNGDVSLAQNTKFKKFKRSERKFILTILENCSNIIEDMIRYKKRWLRLGEILHPSEYKNHFPKANEAFNIIRNDKLFKTFNMKIEKALQNNDILQSIELLKTRPSELARRLDYLLRLSEKSNISYWEQITNDFSLVVSQVSTPVLLQVMTHFKHRNEKADLRSFFPKGNVAKVFALENTLPPINQDACMKIIEIIKSELINRFKNYSSLGKVFLSKELKHFKVPFSQRSANKASHTPVRGSRIAIPNLGSTIRLFLWWKEDASTKRVDLDLSSIMFDKSWNYIEHISYTNLKSQVYKAYHSGDITSAPQGACEFIDLDIESILKYGGRYVVATVFSFTKQDFVDLPECYMGWMMRKNPNSGEIFEPKTVQDKLDLTSKSKVSIPLIFDLVTRELIWSDISLESNSSFYCNLENNKKGISLMGKALTNLLKTDLYQLFELHALARGVLVDTEKEADTVFSLEKGITPFDLDIISSRFL